jgi:alpha-tubulin suppressor-like RCC1 family protein
MPTPVAGGHVFMQLDAGAIHTCGVTTAGDVYCWGYNYYGQLGTGSNVSSTTPVQIASPAGVTFSQVAAGDLHTCAVATTGDVYCWGYNYYGQVGDGTQTDNYNPTNVATGMVSVTAAALHTCALNALGDVWCWGYGGAGQFGNGTYVTINVSPVAGASGYGFTRLFAGVNTYSTCGVTAANAAYCWGDNARGQLGDGTTDGTATPAAVVGGIPFVAMDITGNHTCGASIYGRAYCWGSWDWGETGQGGSLPITPQTVSGGSGFTAVSVGRYHSCALSGTAAYCWGYNGQGQLGNGGGVEMAAPAAVSGGYAFQSLSTGEYHSCGVTTTGVGYCWGNNYYGSLGDGTTAYAQLSPVAVAGGLLFSQIDAGRGFTTCGLTDVGAAYCWGQNDQGQLGTGVVGDSAIAPDSVHTPLTFGQIATGQGHACALTTTAGGDIWCWGANDYGQLGDGTQTDNPTPVQVDNLGGSLSFTSVRAGGLHTCATTSANETYCWGYGYTGALGDGMGNISAVPVLVSGGHDFTDLGLGRYSSCGAEAGGGYCWGDNGRGQLGTGTLDYEYTPAAIAGGHAFTRVTGGWYHGCGTTSADTYCWGQNDYGQLGTGAFNRYLTPHLVVGGIVAQSPPAFTLPSVTGSSVRRSLRP